ncbi:MAG TPA: phosphatase PAP2 family protein [Bacteroides sp.]|nr:phosphatase PAP2 family protein [Bacteroides sp.]
MIMLNYLVRTPGSAILLLTFLLSQVTVSAQYSDSTDIAPAWHQRTAVQVLAVPTILMGAGIATMGDNGLYSSQDAYECIQEKYPDFHTSIDDYLLWVPAATVYGLNLAGVKGKNNFVDRSLIYVISVSLASLTSTAIKNTTGVLRPDGSANNSFPSGHTTVAFVSATFLHEEYKDLSLWYSVAGYSVATATGVLRMLNNKHWMSDVFFGAGLGILSTKVVYLVYPHMKNMFGSKNNSSNLTLIPSLYNDHYGIYLQYRFN